MKSILISFIILGLSGALVAGDVKFSPTRCSELKVSLLNARTSDIKLVEKDFKLNDRVDGEPGRSTLEDCLYASLVFGEDKKAVLNGIYYFERCLFKNKKNPLDFITAQKIIENSAKSVYEVTLEEIEEIKIAVRRDHLLETNPNAKQLIKDLGKEKGTQYVEAIAVCWYNPSTESRQKVLDLAKAIVPSRPPFPIGTYGSLRKLCVEPLRDVSLISALNDIQDKFNKGLDYSSVSIGSAN